MDMSKIRLHKSCFAFRTKHFICSRWLARSSEQGLRVGAHPPVEPVMPPGTSAPCVTCTTMYPTKPPSTKAPLGEAPNKYCYRSKCQERGRQLGHIKGGEKRGGAAGSGVPISGVAEAAAGVGCYIALFGCLFCPILALDPIGILSLI